MQENDQELKKKLQQGLNELGCTDIAMHDKLWQYLLLLKKWNQVYNLTAVRDVDEMISHHVLDSLAVAPYLKGIDFIDVGTGPGLPGIPLSIIMPDKHFTLLDSNNKKTAFLVQAKAALKLDNMTVICSRVKDYTGSYDGVLSRAFSALDEFIESTQHLLKKDGEWYAMKGPQYIDEIKEISNFSHNTLALKIPFLAKERFLTIIKNTGVL